MTVMCDERRNSGLNRPRAPKRRHLRVGAFIGEDLVDHQVIPADAEVFFSIGHGRTNTFEMGGQLRWE